MIRSRTMSASALVLLVVSFIPMAAATARPTAIDTDIREIPDLGDGKILPIRTDRSDLAAARQAPGAAARYRVGSRRQWPAYDEALGLYLKRYKLKGKGKNIEVWVASGRDPLCDGDPETPCPAGDEAASVVGTQFPEGDCRNDRVKVTKEQVNYLINEFDRNIYPKESKTYSVPPDRNGYNAPLARQLGIPKNYWKGGADNIVVLVDNVRDENFYDLEASPTYIAGFFSSAFNFYVKRNVMTIDAFDWLHRTGANPPNEPVPGDLCASKPARPFLYEGVFAHEYEHLLESYEDPNEGLWTDEGLGDFAGGFTGYFDFEKSIEETGHETSTQCFLGWSTVQTPANPNPREGGPSNSLNLWADHGDDQILCDYGAANSMMQFLDDSFGRDFMTRLHRLNKNGFKGLEEDLEQEGSSLQASDVVHQWLGAVALDGIIGPDTTFHGGDPATYSVQGLDATINWDNESAYLVDPAIQPNEGAPPNGGDFVRFRKGNGNNFLAADKIDSIEFQGVKQLPALPMEWTVEQNPPGHDGNPALYSGKGDNLNRAMARQVAVPQNGATLTFDTRYNVEEGYDYGYVEVSTDNGETWTKLENDDTVSESGFNGNSGCDAGTQGTCEPKWISTSFDLSQYAGQNVYIAFRYESDSGVALDGWWVDNVKVGDTVISDGSSTDGWMSPTQVNPIEANGYTVQLIAYTDDKMHAYIARLPLDADFRGSLTGEALTNAIGTEAQTVAAIVTYDDPTESVNQYAPYTLTVNGDVQPGGS